MVGDVSKMGSSMLKMGGGATGVSKMGGRPGGG